MSDNIFRFGRDGESNDENHKSGDESNIVRTSTDPNDFDQSDELWFLHPLYRPCPALDVEVGEYAFRFRPEMGQYFTRQGFEGKSLVAISSEIGIPFPVIKYWAQMNPSFAVSLELSRQNAQFYWEEKGRSGLESRTFNFVGWLRMMSIRFPEHWTDLQNEIEDFTRPSDDRSERVFNLSSPEEEQEAIDKANEVIAKLIRLKHDGDDPAKESAS